MDIFVILDIAWLLISSGWCLPALASSTALPLFASGVLVSCPIPSHPSTPASFFSVCQSHSDVCLWLWFLGIVPSLDYLLLIITLRTSITCFWELFSNGIAIFPNMRVFLECYRLFTEKRKWPLQSGIVYVMCPNCLESIPDTLQLVWIIPDLCLVEQRSNFLLRSIVAGYVAFLFLNKHNQLSFALWKAMYWWWDRRISCKVAALATFKMEALKFKGWLRVLVALREALSSQNTHGGSPSLLQFQEV